MATQNSKTNDAVAVELDKAISMALDAQKKSEGATVLLTHALYSRVVSGDVSKGMVLKYASGEMEKDKKSEALEAFLVKNSEAYSAIADLCDKDSEAAQVASIEKKTDARRNRNAVRQMAARAFICTGFLFAVQASDISVTKANKLRFTDKEGEQATYGAAALETAARAHFRKAPEKKDGANSGQGASTAEAAEKEAVANIPVKTLAEMLEQRINGTKAEAYNNGNREALQGLLVSLMAVFAAKDDDATTVDGRKLSAMYKAAVNG